VATVPLSRTALTALTALASLLLVAGSALGAAADPVIEREPSAADLARQQAQVTRLQAQARSQATDVAHAQRALQAAAVIAGQALEDYSLAVRALQDAQQTEQSRAQELQQATYAVRAGRRQVGRWARQAYQGGSPLASDPTLNTLLTPSGSQDRGTTLVILRRIGVARTRALDQAETARRSADRTRDAAADATEQAAGAAIAATRARQAGELAVARQRQILGLAETDLAQTQTDAAAARSDQTALKAAREAAGSAADSGAGTGPSNPVTGAVGSCTGADVGQYPNGQIPLGALCPLRAAPGHYLRADAAYAFDRLSYAYAHQFGTPICVTDSYRSYSAQVDLYARKPNLAAVPGTSNHGWGTATDLCGGIQDFGTPAHRWMTANAPLYGWFHPGWAQPGGSRPEPWHWEYGG
jgi:hypothetical protein